MVPDERNGYLWRKGFHLFFPMRGPDHWRVVGILPEKLRGHDGLTFDDVIPSVRGEAGAALRFKSCSWFSTYLIRPDGHVGLAGAQLDAGRVERYRSAQIGFRN
jgi:hypothetical protein